MVRVSIERRPGVMQGSRTLSTVAILARGGERRAVDRCTCLLSAHLRSGCNTAARVHVPHSAREFAVPWTCAHAEPFITALSRSTILRTCSVVLVPPRCRAFHHRAQPLHDHTSPAESIKSAQISCSSNLDKHCRERSPGLQRDDSPCLSTEKQLSCPHFT